MGSLRAAIFLGVICIAGTYLYSRRTGLAPQMNGVSSHELKPVVHSYKNFIESGYELGSSFAVYSQHKQVLNLVGGYADLRFGLLWSSDTITQAFTLSMLSIPLTFALLYERGLIRLDDPVVQYLPAFSVPNITISDLLTHQSGFPYFRDPIHLAAWRDDYSRMLLNITHQVPPAALRVQKWHFHSLALLADGIVRRVDLKSRTLGHYFMEEIAWPLGLDLMIGLPRSQLYRAARTYHADLSDILSAVLRFDLSFLRTALSTPSWLFQDSDRTRAFNIFSDYELLRSWNPDLLEVPLASTHMFTNARSLARLLTLLYTPTDADETTGSTSLKPTAGLYTARTLAWLLQDSSTAKSAVSSDPVLHRPLRLTSAGLMVEQSPEGNPIFGMWDDILGQVAFVDPHRRVTFAYMTNHAHGCSLKRDSILSSLLSNTYSCF